ncbi:MAG: acyltransferase [Bacteroidales bacterium]|nr:acyltransferase [Bacteroidales bacterium]
MSQRLDSIQALRGAACLAVVGFHLTFWNGRLGMSAWGFDAYRWFGYAGVDLFFVLSGFVMLLTNRKKIGQPAAVPGYMFRRFWRIYPTYWVTFAAVLGLFLLLLPGYENDPIWDGRLLPALALSPLVDNGVLGVAWTLSFEVMFYLIFGLLLLLPPRGMAIGCGLWAVAVAGAWAFPQEKSALAMLVSPFCAEFLAGCLMAWLITRGVTGYRWGAILGAVIWAGSGIGIVSWTHDLPIDHVMANHRIRVLVWGPPAALLVYGLIACERRGFRRWPRGLLVLGDASYSIYLTHFPMMVVSVLVAMQIHRTPLLHMLWCLLTFTVCVGGGWLWYRVVEKPLLGVLTRRGEAVPGSPTRVAWWKNLAFSFWGSRATR